MVTVVTTQMPADIAHRNAWIKFELARRGLNISKLARTNGFKSHSALSQAMRRSKRQDTGGRAARVIARALGMKPKDLWPERYEKKPKKKKATKGGA
jgi:lambda repressor-like predicted transcriptional regulator